MNQASIEDFKNYFNEVEALIQGILFEIYSNRTFFEQEDIDWDALSVYDLWWQPPDLFLVEIMEIKNSINIKAFLVNEMNNKGISVIIQP
jgi:hypothetical protein